jgi:hypothetical protein
MGYSGFKAKRRENIAAYGKNRPFRRTIQEEEKIGQGEDRHER